MLDQTDNIEALQNKLSKNWLRRLSENLPKRRQIGFIIIVAALASCLISFAILLGYTPVSPTGAVVIRAVIINSCFALALFYLILQETWHLMVAKRQGRAAARFHIRIIGLFGLVASIPAIIVAVIAAVTLDRGLDRWFAERTQTIVSSSREVAQAYIFESARGLQGTTLSMANDLNKADRLFRLDPGGFQTLLNRQTRGRGLLGASLVTGDGEYIVKADSGKDINLPDPPLEALTEAGNGDPVLIRPGNTNIVGSVIRLQNIPIAYLYTTRQLDSIVSRSLKLMENNTRLYDQLSDSRVSVQFAFAVLYMAVTLILLLSAIWVGIGFADRLVAPIRQLIAAATQVRGGNMSVRVPVETANGDVGALSDTFNRMIEELSSQRDEIVSARDQMDRRRRFTEAVLSGVTPGVMGVDSSSTIRIANPAAQIMLGESKIEIVGLKLADIAQQIDEILQMAMQEERQSIKQQITLMRSGRERTWNIQVTEEASVENLHSYVITIDDITDLVAAQRDSAWGDVARRIAHEIKNPLTPIQLSAERLKRRYGKKLTEDREVFDQCTQTIIRQVADIGRMVNEFSQFARMPKPNFERADLKEAIKEAVFLSEVTRPEIKFEMRFEQDPLHGHFDPRLISQAIGNVVKNASESIEALLSENSEYKGIIQISGSDEGKFLKIIVTDNGVGLPKESRQRLMEPYMTTREKGTGLGLAIVRKIIEEHGGHVDLTDAPDIKEQKTGAMVTMTIAKKNNVSSSQAEADGTHENIEIEI